MPRVNTTVLDALLNAARAGTNIYVTEVRPTDRASALANALHSQTVTRALSSNTGGAGLTVDGDNRRYTDGPYPNITLDAGAGARTPTYIAVTDATNLLVVADVQNPTSVPIGTVIDLGSWEHRVLGPTSS